MFLNENKFSREYEEEAQRLKLIIEEDFQPHMFIAIVLGGKLYNHNYYVLYFIIPVVLLALYDIKKKGGLNINKDLIISLSLKIGLLIIFYTICFFSIRFESKALILQYAVGLPFYMYGYYSLCRGGNKTSAYY
ncbi:MAG: hypothetical protein CVV49_07095 [Spirochaetae bacterium HGW-Spirochaetae-5]|nr:MAG: hypothetical protein CVV49_07095 [Spirochaetae bacterium HGW-Spirochaetae-5]